MADPIQLSLYLRVGDHAKWLDRSRAAADEVNDESVPRYIRKLREMQRRGGKAKPVRLLLREHFFRSERAAVHSYGPDPHSC